MNIDPSNKAQEQEEQNQQTTTTGVATGTTTTTTITTTTTATATTTAVLALLISPSSPSSTSTVSPTASSISKNSSTDEVDETTAEAEPPQLEAKGSQLAEAAADRGQEDEQRRQQLVFEQRADEDVHRNNSEQRTGTEQSLGVDCRGSIGQRYEPNVTMTLDIANTTINTLLGQCIPENVTTELRTLELEASAVAPAGPALESEANRDSNCSKEEYDTLSSSSSSIAVEPVRELTAEALSPPKTPQPSLSSSSSSSSSTSSTPSVGEERRLPVVPEEDSYAEDPPAGECCYRQPPLATSNNNPALVLEVDLTSADSGAGGCINDRYNNNSKRSDSDFQIVLGDSTQAKVANRDDDDYETAAVAAAATSLSSASGCCTVVSSAAAMMEEGVRTSAVTVTPATEIALGQGERQRCAITTPTNMKHVPSGDEHERSNVVSQPLLRKAERTEAAVRTNDDNNCELPAVAPIELVQTLPIETTDPTTQQGGIITAASVTVAADIKNEAIEGVTTRTERSKTFATDPADGSPPSSSSLSSSSSTAPLSPPSSSACSLSSSESSPEVLAVSQQEPSGKGNDTQPVADNRPFGGDSSPQGRSLEGEGLSDAVLVRTQPAPPPCSVLRSVEAAGVVPRPCTVGEGGGTSTTTTRLLTLAEELSQAAAAASSSSPSASPALAVSVPPSAVADVLPKSAADTPAAAVVSGSSRSTSPVLHSSLKKSSKMGVTTGAAAATEKGENRRRVSFPQDAQLITGYLDPVNPWACISVCETPELLKLYHTSCKRHNTMPLKTVLDHLQSIDVTKGRVPLLSLKDQHLSYSECEALEEIFKHVQYRCIDLSHSGLDDVTASIMFDIIEYYEAAQELDISDNLQMSGKSWTACINMIKKSQALNVLIMRGPMITNFQANNLAKALNTSAIHTLKLEHCVLSQEPIASLCSTLKRNKVLRELWLAHNQLCCEDALQIANLLRANLYIQLIDISNNRIGDKGVDHIVSAIVEQAVHFKEVQEKKRKSDLLTFSDLSSSLNSINSAKNYFPQRLRSSDSDSIVSTVTEPDLDASPSPLTLTPPVTPPSTPALPPCETTSTEEKKKKKKKVEKANETPEGTNGTTTIFAGATEEAASVYTTIAQHQPDNDETNPPLPPSPVLLPAPPTPPPGAVAPSNVNLVEMSTKHSVSLQTTSDREKPDMVARPVMMTAEEEALMNSSSGGATVAAAAVAAVAVLGDGDESKTTMKSTSAETVQTDHREPPTVVPEVDCVELLVAATVAEEEPHSDSPVPQAAKKPRLAKQDSVLTEFEASLSTAMEIGDQREEKRNPAPEQLVTKEVSRAQMMMEEDVPELCTDYDDDGSNLRISQENLFVDLGIPALSEEERESETRSASVESSGDVFLPLAPPSKKDELQLLFEKSQQKEKGKQQQQAESEDVQLQTNGGLVTEKRERKSAINSSSEERLEVLPSGKKDRTQSSSSTISTDSIVVEKAIQIKDSVPLSRSLDSVGGDESDFESSSPFRTTAPTTFPNERSFSSESLNSETSIDSNDSKSSLKIHESKFAAKNGTLERQQSNVNRDTVGTEQAPSSPCGLQVLVLWNNEITRNSARHFQRLLERTSTLDTLNVGSNQLCNSFVTGISGSLKANTTLTNLGLQGAHLSDKGVKTMAEIIEFGGNSSLQRIDLRHNNIQKAGLEALNDAMKSNKSITRIDLDDTPRRIKDTSLDGVGSEYSRLVNNIRAQCERNKNPPEPSEPISTTVRRARANYLSSRKISLTCPSIKTSPSALADKQHLLDPNGGCKKSTGGRLRSPLPSPIPSPIASPVPSPSRNRFHVSRVTDSTGGGGGSLSSPSPSSTGSSPTLFFPSNSRFRVVTVAEPDVHAGAKSANNPYRSSSTISLPMSGKSSTSSFTVGGSGGGGVGGAGAGTGGTTSATTINRRPVCSSAPTLSSFPSSPLSPLATGAGGVPMVGRVASQTPSPLLPPSYGSGSNNTFHTAILPSPLITSTSGVIAGSSSPTTMSTILPMPNNSMSLGVVAQCTLLQQQQQQQLQYQPLPPPPQIVPMMHQQQPQNYHFVTTFGPGSNTMVPLQPNMVTLSSLQTQIVPQTILHQQQQQQQQQIPPQVPSPSSCSGKVRQSPNSSDSAHQHSSSNSNSNNNNNNSGSTLHDSVLSSTSIESPDLEVKRFMSGGTMLDDSCCSSISSNSIDSIDAAHFNINASISSTEESFDMIVSSPPPVISASTSASTGGGGGSSESSHNVLEEESTLIPKASSLLPTVVTLDAPPASFSTSSMVQVNLASSQESLYDVHDLSGSSNSSSISAAANLAATTTTTANTKSTVQSTASLCAGTGQLGGNNSNESTLTSVQNLEREPTTAVASSKVVTTEKPPRVRKTSWILGGSGSSSNSSSKHADSSSSGASTPTPSGGSGYPPAIEKLLSIFHPSSLFSSNKSSASPPPPPAVTQEGSTHGTGGGSQPPSRKESPMGGLFYWAHHSSGNSGNSSSTSANTSPTSTTTKKDDDRGGLKVNVSPETTLTPQQLQPLQNQAHVMAHHQHHLQQQQQHSAEHMPPQLKVEMKENISPENTITNKLLLSSSNASAAGSGALDAPTIAMVSSPTVNVPVGSGGIATPHAKVIFQLGGDYDESEDDIDTLTNKYGNHPSVGGTGGAAGGGGGGGGIHYFGGGPSSLMGGSTTSNSSGISIGSSGTSAGGDLMMLSGSSAGIVVSPSPSAASGQSGTSDTVVVLSHLGQLARDSLSMFKNPSLTSQDSISIRSMDSLTEIGNESGKTTQMAVPQPPSSSSSSPSSVVPTPTTATTTTSTTISSSLSLSSTTASATQMSAAAAAAAPLADRQETR